MINACCRADSQIADHRRQKPKQEAPMPKQFRALSSLHIVRSPQPSAAAAAILSHT